MRVIIAQDKQTILDHYAIRGRVFIVEQNIAWEIEFDAYDYAAVFFVLYDGEVPIGAARLYKNKVGRVAVLIEHRHKKVGTLIMHAVEAYAKQLGYEHVELGAQLTVIPFYESLGYVGYGDVFLDADIEHLMMRKDL